MTDWKAKIYEWISAAEPLNEDLSRQLFEQVRNSGAMLSVLKDIMLEADAKASTLLVCDLTTPQGVTKAAQIQAMSQGIGRALEIFIDCAANGAPEEKEDANDNTE